MAYFKKTGDLLIWFSLVLTPVYSVVTMKNEFSPTNILLFINLEYVSLDVDF